MQVNLVGYNFENSRLLPSELRALCAIAKWRRPHTVFEIGTFKGGTTLFLCANSNAKIYTLDLAPKGHPDFIPPPVDDPELDVFPETPGICFRGTEYAERIHQLYGNSQVFDFAPFFTTMDIVFVDGDHHYDAVLKDSMNAFKMVGNDGYILWHDYAEYAPEVVRALKTVANRFPLTHIEETSLVVYSSPKTSVPAGSTLP